MDKFKLGVISQEWLKIRDLVNYFTPPHLSVSAVWSQLATNRDSFRQNSIYLRLNSCKLETGSRQEKTVLSPIQFTLPTRTWQDKTVLSCPCRQC